MPEKVNRKLDLMVKKLLVYLWCGVQESEWFSVDVWTAKNFTYLHSGRPLPGSTDMATRNEGVGIRLDARASEAWRQGGGVWKTVSSTVVTKMKWTNRSQR